MTREEFVKFRDEVLTERFYWCYTVAERKYLTEKGYKYLFRCTHYKSGRFFWVFDKTDALMSDVKIWKKNLKEKGVSDAAIDG